MGGSNERSRAAEFAPGGEWGFEEAGPGGEEVRTGVSSVD